MLRETIWKGLMNHLSQQINLDDTDLTMFSKAWQLGQNYTMVLPLYKNTVDTRLKLTAKRKKNNSKKFFSNNNPRQNKRISTNNIMTQMMTLLMMMMQEWGSKKKWEPTYSQQTATCTAVMLMVNPVANQSMKHELTARTTRMNKGQQLGSE